MDTDVSRKDILAVTAAVLLVFVSFAFLSSSFVGSGFATADGDADTLHRDPGSVKTVAVVPGGEERLWPYTSRARDYETRTLPINVVVQADASRVRYLLAERTDARWNSTVGEWEATGEDDSITVDTNADWAHARGATRYTYIHGSQPTDQQPVEAANGGGGSRWIAETYQLHNGNYFGTRYHLRLYAGGAGDHAWTAIQAHHEHWDWFRLRHTVSGLAQAQKHVEDEFRDQPITADVSREWYANGGDNSGWVTVIEFEAFSHASAAVALAGLGPALVGSTRGSVDVETAAGAATRWIGDRLEPLAERSSDPIPTDVRALVLFLSLSIFPLYVRVASLGIERSLPNISPKLVAAVFYPFLVIGLPVCAVLAARGLGTVEGFSIAFIGFGAGLLADYTYLGIAALPIGVVLHRLALLTALGLVAAGSARRATRAPDDDGRDPVLLVGIGGWIVTLAWPLLGL